MDTQNSRKMRDGRLPVAANSAADARPSAESPSAEPPTTDQRLTEKDIVGLKYFDQLLPLFKRLHDDGCQRDKAGNRELHFDQYYLMVLVFLFHPICSSLRALQQASELKNVQKKLGCERAALGSGGRKRDGKGDRGTEKGTGPFSPCPAWIAAGDHADGGWIPSRVAWRIV